MEIPASSTSKGELMKVKVWARRVWTLELSLVSPLTHKITGNQLIDRRSESLYRCASG